jgi:hypothetical protein
MLRFLALRGARRILSILAGEPPPPRARHNRVANDGSCYVNVGQSPTAVWRAYHRGAYSTMTPAMVEYFNGRAVRFGAYGDPAAVPYDVWRPILDVAGRWTGYTHQWRTCDQRCRGFLMASCDGLADREEARARGWRTFRIRTADGPLLPGEFMCPASDEAGKRTTCERCCACNGTRLDTRRSAGNPAIIVHGAKAGRFQMAG